MLSFNTLVTITLACLAAASPLTALSIAAREPSPNPLSIRDAGTDLLLTDLAALDLSIKSLKASLTAYQGGVAAAAPVLTSITAVHLANRHANSDAMTISKQSLADSRCIIAYVNDPIAKDIPESVDVLISKKQAFVDAGLRSQIVDGLKLLLGDHESFSATVAGKLNKLTLVQAAVPVAVIDAAIRKGIVAFVI